MKITKIRNIALFLSGLIIVFIVLWISRNNKINSFNVSFKDFHNIIPLILWLFIAQWAIPFEIDDYQEKWHVKILQNIISPIFEEGILTILPWLWIDNNDWFMLFILGKSILFSSLHANKNLNTFNFVYLFTLSMMLSLSLVVTNNFLAPILLHILNNVLLSERNQRARYKNSQII